MKKIIMVIFMSVICIGDVYGDDSLTNINQNEQGKEQIQLDLSALGNMEDSQKKLQGVLQRCSEGIVGLYFDETNQKDTFWEIINDEKMRRGFETEVNVLAHTEQLNYLNFDGSMIHEDLEGKTVKIMMGELEKISHLIEQIQENGAEIIEDLIEIVDERVLIKNEASFLDASNMKFTAIFMLIIVLTVKYGIKFYYI